MEPCPCGSGNDYAQCCEPALAGTHPPETAEALMRSRYTAYVKNNTDYIAETTHPSKRSDYDKEGGAKWAKHYEWQSLTIVDTQQGGAADETGTVEFIARYRVKGNANSHHEIAEFSRQDGRWYFLDGQAPKPVQSIRQGPKIGRNDPCPCGSGKKHKKCCGK